MTYRIIFYIIGIGMLLFFSRDVYANSTTIVSPNGGNCLTVGQAFTIEFSWSGADVEHVALYYRTDGQQPSHLDSSTIKHPINVPQQGTTWNWTPGTSDISETGRMWIDGHGHNHSSLGTWDSSDANFAVRSSCAGGGAVVPPPQETVSGKSIRLTPQPPQGFSAPADVVDVIPSIISARIQFSVPWENGLYRVRFLEEKEGGIFIAKREEKDMRVQKGEIIEFLVDGLEPNIEYNKFLFIQAYDYTFGFESVRSKIVPSFWTLLDAPKEMKAVEISPTSVILELVSSVPNLNSGVSQVLFENVTTSAHSNWTGDTRWKAEGLTADTQYQFWAKARNGKGIETPFGALLTLKTPPVPEEKGPSKEEIKEREEREQLRNLKKIIEPIAETLQLFAMRNQIREIEQAIGMVFETRRAEKERQRESAKEKESVSIIVPREQIPHKPPVFSRAPVTFNIQFKDGRFSPEIIKIQPGDRVRWTNDGDFPVWPASDPHPTHTGSIGFDAYGDLLQGEFYEHTFRKSGIWPYHDHSSALTGKETGTGAVIVRMPESEALPEAAEKIFELPKVREKAPSREIPVEAEKIPAQEAVPVPSLLLPEEKKAQEVPFPEKETAAATTTPVSPKQPPRTFVVLIDETGFNPAVLEINAGDTVRWVQRSNKPFWPASDPHPTHTGLPGFDALGDIFRGESYQYTFRESGMHPYHNHTQARIEIEPEAGTIIVRP